MESTLLQDSKVKIQTRQDSEVTFKIRRPGYAGKQEITVDGQTAKAVLEKGYLLINTPAGEHEICIDFGVKPRWIAANDEVRADAGRCALMNGPVVYCLEETDNGKYLADLYVEENTEVTKGIRRRISRRFRHYSMKLQGSITGPPNRETCTES